MALDPQIYTARPQILLTVQVQSDLLQETVDYLASKLAYNFSVVNGGIEWDTPKGAHLRAEPGQYITGGFNAPGLIHVSNTPPDASVYQPADETSVYVLGT